jgi:hypothetical protein
MFYCRNCKTTIEDDDIMVEELISEIRYPNDLAREAEYSDPKCPACNETINDYFCDECGASGNQDDKRLLVRQDEMICLQCLIDEFEVKFRTTLLMHIYNEHKETFDIPADDEGGKYIKELIVNRYKRVVEKENKDGME